jgi:hypothetical protein
MESKTTPDDLATLLHTLWCHQAPSQTGSSAFQAGAEPLPAPLCTRDAVGELVRWALAQADEPDLAAEALQVAAWLLDDPAVTAAARPWLLSPHRDERLAACITLFEKDPDVASILQEDARGDRPGDLMELVQPFCLRRADPGAIAALLEVAGESQHDPDTQAAVGHLARWASDAQLERLSGVDATEAMASLLPLRDHPGTVAASLAELGMWEEYRSLRVLEGLAERADPGCIEGVLSRWDEVCLTSSKAQDYRYNVPYEAAGPLLDGLAATPGGEAELRRLSTHADASVVTLARTFLLRAAPEETALAALLAMRTGDEDPDDARYAPLQEFLDEGGVEAWVPAAPLTPAPRIPVAPRPAFLELPPRAAGARALVEPPPPPNTGWTWVPAPTWPTDAPEWWSDLPVIAHLDDLPVYFAAPLVDAGRAELLGDMEQQLTYDVDWGVPEWPREPFLDDAGGVTRAWTRALRRAARTLAARHQGREDEWLGFLCHSLARPAEAVRARVATRPSPTS